MWRRWFSGWIAAVGVIVGSPCAWGWNEPGHQLIGLLASEQLPEATYQAVVETLRQHPTFDPHFLSMMPADIWRGNEAEKARWCFCHAGQWPDLVKGGPPLVTDEEKARFNRPGWHYLDLPIFVGPPEPLAAAISAVNTRRDLPEEVDESKLNALQALELALKRLRDPQTLPPERAVALCWVSHLVADLHQPCHSVSLYSEKVFPEGDRGASILETTRRQDLHALWDRSLLDRVDFSTVRAKAQRMKADVAAVPDETVAASPSEWLDESAVLAERLVYTPSVREQIEGWERDGKAGQLEIDADYLQGMRQASEQRAAVAARRLAALIESAAPHSDD